MHSIQCWLLHVIVLDWFTHCNMDGKLRGSYNAALHHSKRKLLFWFIFSPSSHYAAVTVQSRPNMQHCTASFFQLQCTFFSMNFMGCRRGQSIKLHCWRSVILATFVLLEINHTCAIISPWIGPEAQLLVWMGPIEDKAFFLITQRTYAELSFIAGLPLSRCL